MKLDRLFATFMAFFVALGPMATTANADPCGMVPPITIGIEMPIARVGLQKTYVFYKNGIESLVIRPGFTGEVDEFGMLIPFPSPPAIRKVADDVFPHVAAAIDPPEVVVDLRQRWFAGRGQVANAPGMEDELMFARREVKKDEVRVLKEEAVGMYEVAVLDAGSAEALKRWMDDHGFRYPEGMDSVCEEYVEIDWCFVAVKAKVGDKGASDPRPGMREVDTAMPGGSSFDGHVQAMGFRFRTDEFVVPMRLSAFNEGDLRNVVYVLSDQPTRIANLPSELVVRQIHGYQLYRNLTDPLPLRILGGSLSQLPDWQRQNLPVQRDPVPHNGIARELFASDLLAVRTGNLSHPFEEKEKELLAIGEALGLRGPELDVLHHEALKEEREEMITAALADLQSMTLTVIDGDFDRETIAAENLEFVAFSMPARQNRAEEYDARHFGPAPKFGGFTTTLPPGPPFYLGFFAVAGLLIAGLYMTRRNERRTLPRLAPAAGAFLFGLFLFGGAAYAQECFRCQVLLDAERDVEQVHDEHERNEVADLLARARNAEELTERGHAIVALAELGGDAAELGLEGLHNSTDSQLVQLWAAAALVQLADSAEELTTLSARTPYLPALTRPVTNRWLALLSDPEAEVRLEVVLDALAQSHPLQQKLLPMLLARGPGAFVDVMLGAESQNARNLAAGCLATLAAQGQDGIAIDVLAALEFDPEAVTVPWQGGPLFLPSVSWTKEEGTLLFESLVAWHLFCDRRSLRQEQRQIHNNLNSWALANAVGYSMPGQEIDTTRWLLLLGETLGEDPLREILEAQGLEDHYRFKAVLTLVSRR